MSVLKWILAIALFAGAIALALELQDARAEIEIQRSSIEAAWDTLARDMHARENLLPELIETVRAVPGVGRQFPLRESMATVESRLATVATSKERPELIEANQRLELAVGTFAEALAATPAIQAHREILGGRDRILALENQIDLDRTAYNEAVQRFNVRLALFPANLTARLAGIARHEAYVPTALKPEAPAVSNPALPAALAPPTPPRPGSSSAEPSAQSLPHR